jgi:hypothetical protein
MREGLGIRGYALVGETEQMKGRRGALLAKRWLDRTTRVNANLVNPDRVAAKKLTLKKAVYNGPADVFSYDLGGNLRGGELDGQEFLAECKFYKNASDLSTHFRIFLAHCYRAVATEHLMADRFFWISFAPHSATIWERIKSPDAVKAAVLHKACIEINFRADEIPEIEFSDEIAKMVSERVWVIILSDEQVEHLSLSKEHHGVIEKYIIESASENVI